MNEEAEKLSAAKSHLARSHRGKSMRRLAPALLPFLVLVVSGWRGLDYGAHWDEPRQLWVVEQMIKSETLLPGTYNYPSLDYWIDLAALTPEFVRSWRNTTYKPYDELINTVRSRGYLLRLRAVHLLISSLAVIWVYLLVINWGRSRIEALTASSILALSWQVAYHLRWSVTDGLVMQFGALTALLLVLSFNKPNGLMWLRLAAIAAGLGFATKYPAGLLITPVFIAAYFHWSRATAPSSLIRLSLELAAIFAVVYLICTPGTLLQPFKFFHGITYEFKHYALVGHRGHTLSRGPIHAWYILVYLSTALFSRYNVISLLFFAFSLVGSYALIKEESRRAAIFLFFPIVYMVFFSMQRVMFVRNLLVVTPFLSVAAARGIVFFSQRLNLKSKPWRLTEKLQLNPLRTGFAVVILAVLLVNSAWLIYAGETIASRAPDRFIKETAAYLSAKKGDTFFLSPMVRERLASLGPLQFPNVSDNPGNAKSIVFYSSEATNRMDWPHYTPALTETWFGPYEVDFNYYPSWGGKDRVVVMSAATARRIRVEGVNYPASNNGATFVSQSVPSEMVAGQTYDVAVTMRNTGTTTWRAEQGYFLGSQNPEDNLDWNKNRLPIPQSVEPGTEVTFNFSVKAPIEAKTYNFRWRMVQDGIDWFGDSTPNLAFKSVYPTIIHRAVQEE